MVGGIEATDFTNIPLRDLGREVTRNAATKTTNSYGDEIVTYGPDQTITAIVMRKKNNWTQEKTGESNNADGYIMVAPTTELTRNDKITFDGETFKVKNLITRGTPTGIDIYKYADLYYIR